KAGLCPASRIGIILPYGPAAVVAIVATMCCAVAVPLDPRLTPAELEQCLSDLGLDAILTMPGSPSVDRCSVEGKGIAVIEVVPKGNGELGVAVTAPSSEPAPSYEEANPDVPAFVLQTSGTTDRPKLIPF